MRAIISTLAPLLIVFLLFYFGSRPSAQQRKKIREQKARHARIRAVVIEMNEEMEQLSRPAVWPSPPGVGGTPQPEAGPPSPVFCEHKELASPQRCARCGYDPRYHWTSYTRDNVTSYVKGGCRHLATEDIKVCEWAPSLNGELVGRLCLNCGERIEGTE